VKGQFGWYLTSLFDILFFYNYCKNHKSAKKFPLLKFANKAEKTKKFVNVFYFNITPLLFQNSASLKYFGHKNTLGVHQ
jgi:hypothetical protein